MRLRSVRVAGCLYILLLLVCVLMRPVAVQAKALHATLVRSDPEARSVLTTAPTAVNLVFSERIHPVGRALQVRDPDGKPVERGSVRVNGQTMTVNVEIARTGTYRVTWQVISQDTEPVSGRFIFSVRQAGGIWAGSTEEAVLTRVSGDGLQASARWLHYAGYALSFGVLAFYRLVLYPLVRRPGERGERHLWRLVDCGIVLLLLAEPLAFLARMVSLGMDSFVDPTLSADILASSFGHVLGQRLGVAILLWAVMVSIRQGSLTAITMMLIMGLALAMADGQASHALTANPLWLGMITNMVHVAAMGLWVGGLISLLVIGRLSELRAIRGRLVARFGFLAMIAVAELAISGVIMALLQLSHPIDLFVTAYGNSLLLKLGLVLLAVLLALLALHKSPEGQECWWKYEALVLSLVLLLAGLLVSLPPP